LEYYMPISRPRHGEKAYMIELFEIQVLVIPDVVMMVFDGSSAALNHYASGT
jgi:hypothetical protein